MFDAVDGLAEVADEASMTLHDLAYSWLLGQPGVTSVIAGPRTVAHLHAAVSASSRALPDGLSPSIDEIVPSGGVVLPQYGHDGLAWVPWGPHESAWR